MKTEHEKVDQASEQRQGTRYFVSRHPGAIAWARRHPWGKTLDVVSHLDPATVTRNDTVIGTLPIHLVAAICARGAIYLHLELSLAAHQRGRELSADDLDAAGAFLRVYHAELRSIPPFRWK